MTSRSDREQEHEMGGSKMANDRRRRMAVAGTDNTQDTKHKDRTIAQLQAKPLYENEKFYARSTFQEQDLFQLIIRYTDKTGRLEWKQKEVNFECLHSFSFESKTWVISKSMKEDIKINKSINK